MAACLLACSCLPYIYHERDRVLVPGIDIDSTLDVAELELEGGGSLSVLTIWAIRDQVVTPAQARRISKIYFDHILEVDGEGAKSRKFQVWHLTWAISNLYREGGQEVRQALEDAYADASMRVEALKMKAASLHFAGDEIYMGDAHAGGRAYARKHLVVPGNPDYLQSVKQYLEERRRGADPQLLLYAEPSKKDAELLKADSATPLR
jgi:hypothetical protein